MKSIRQLIQNLKGWITELGEKRKELLAQKAAEEATLLPNLLMKYMEIRKEERKDWTRAGQNLSSNGPCQIQPEVRTGTCAGGKNIVY